MNAEIEAMKIILNVDNGFVLTTETMRKSEYPRTKMPILSSQEYLAGHSGYLPPLSMNSQNGILILMEAESVLAWAAHKVNFFRYFSNENENFFIIIHIESDQIIAKAYKTLIESWISNEEEEIKFYMSSIKYLLNFLFLRQKLFIATLHCFFILKMNSLIFLNSLHAHLYIRKYQSFLKIPVLFIIL